MRGGPEATAHWRWKQPVPSVTVRHPLALGILGSSRGSAEGLQSIWLGQSSVRGTVQMRPGQGEVEMCAQVLVRMPRAHWRDTVCSVFKTSKTSLCRSKGKNRKPGWDAVDQCQKSLPPSAPGPGAQSTPFHAPTAESQWAKLRLHPLSPSLRLDTSNQAYAKHAPPTTSGSQGPLQVPQHREA